MARVGPQRQRKKKGDIIIHENKLQSLSRLLFLFCNILSATFVMWRLKETL